MIADNVTIKRKRAKNKILQMKRKRRYDNLKYGQDSQDDRHRKVEELKVAIHDKIYINQAIDVLAERIASQWIKEKYGSGENKCL